MNMYTTSDINSNWSNIDFTLAEKHIKKLQKRISVAYLNGDNKLMTFLQHQLIHSFYAKALSIKTVMSKKGYNTPGIDNVIWDKSNLSTDKYNAIYNLNHKNYTPETLKRITIKKSNGKKRPIDIPTIKDRAMHTLYKFAIEPIAEISADNSSFAYRKNRSAKDAVNYILTLLESHSQYKYALKVDVQDCFNTISHEWLINNIPFDQKLLTKFLKYNYTYKGVLYNAEQGIPQGGCLSPILSNMTLDGLDVLMKTHFGDDVSLVRYADDIVIFGEDDIFLVQEVLPILKKFLEQRNLKLSEEKTQCVSIYNGFNFLDYYISYEECYINCEPSNKNRTKYFHSLIDVINKNPNLSTKELYKILYPKIRGWCNYYNGIVAHNYIADIEFDTIMIINSLTTNTSLADKLVHKIFDNYYF